MKIIDEKGRLFGWMNLLDLAVVIGFVVLLFVGITAWITLRQPSIGISKYSPAQLSSGSTQTLQVKLNNERYLQAARLFLTPVSYKGSTISYKAKIKTNVRDNLKFSIPEDIRAGTYSASLEVTTMNVFRRKEVTNILMSKKFIVKEVKEAKKSKITGPQFDNMCRWNISFDAVLINIDGTIPALAAGENLLDNTGTSFLITSVAETVDKERLETLPPAVRENAGMLVGLEVVASFDSLAALLNSSGSQLSFNRQGNMFSLYMIDNAKVSLDMLFYLNKPEHVGLLSDQAELSGKGDGGKAIIVKTFGDVDNPWVTKAAVPPEIGLPRAFDVARVSLDCSLKNNGIYFGNSRLEPGRLLAFQTGDVAITAGILSNAQPQLTAVVRVMVEAFPVQLEKLLSAGMPVTDNKGKLLFGKLKRIVDTDRLNEPDGIMTSSQFGFGGSFKRMILDLELDCTFSGDVPQCFGQQLKYGGKFNFTLLGQPLTSIIRHDAELPPRSVRSRETLQVEFRNVMPDLVAWIRVGEREHALNGPSKWKIQRIISSQPSKLYYPNSDGTRITSVDHPGNKDIRCLVELEVIKVGNDLYYNGNLLKIGSGLKFEARRWSKSASVVAF